MTSHHRMSSYGPLPAFAPSAGKSYDSGFYPNRPSSSIARPTSPPSHNRSHSSFRNSHEMAPSARGSTSAYESRRSRQGLQDNRHAFGDDGSESEGSDDGQGFNVYKDFNNSGAKYSSGLSNTEIYREDPYGALPDTPLKGHYSRAPSTPNVAEHLQKSGDLVAAPHIGKDWKDSETRNDKRWEGKGSLETREAWRRRRANAGAKFGAWRRGEQKVGGWFGWRHGVFVAFFLFLAFAITLYFVVPRAPRLAYNHDNFMVGDNTTAHFSRTPTNFTFDATLNLALDGRNSYVPVHATGISVAVIDLSTTAGSVKVGEGSIDSLTTSPKSYKAFSVPVHFSYSAANTSDSTWLAYYSACQHIWPGNVTRPTLLWNVVVRYKILGLVGVKGDSTTVNSVVCPVELPATGA